MEEEMKREASVGQGRRAVAVLLQKMLSAARCGCRFVVIVVAVAGVSCR